MNTDTTIADALADATAAVDNLGVAVPAVSTPVAVPAEEERTAEWRGRTATYFAHEVDAWLSGTVPLGERGIVVLGARLDAMRPPRPAPPLRDGWRERSQARMNAWRTPANSPHHYGQCGGAANGCAPCRRGI